MAADNGPGNADNPVAEAERDRVHRAEGELALMLREHVWGSRQALRLGGEDWEIAYVKDVPGYAGDDPAVLLRRTSDGVVFEAGISVTLREVSRGQ